jgi:ankyrin repeat protein
VYCQLEALRHCLPPSVGRILEELPETLDETYERVLKEINKANREHARRLLQCLTVALRPLRVEELAEVLAIDFDAPIHGGIPQSNPNWRWNDQHQAVLSTCSSLIAIVDDGGYQVVQFSHFSVKEFLTSNRLARSSGDVSRYHILFEPAHTILAQACLGVLLRLDDHVGEDNVGGIPLVEYAARYWIDHAQFENVSSRIRDAMEYFFDADKPHWTAWSLVQKIDASWLSFSPERVGDASPLYYVSLGGFYDLANDLVGKHPEHINARGGLMATPLVAALRGKHFRVAELLHRHGAEVDVRDWYERTPLRAACRAEVLDIVEWLLNHGANVNIQNDSFWTPLHSAADGGRLEVLKMLIEHDADIHMRTGSGRSPLHLAANPDLKDDQVDIMQVLLDHGADPNARDNDNSTPLHHTSFWQKDGDLMTHGTVEGTRLLLEHGAIIDAEDNEGMTPLQLALEHDRDDIATCLKEHGATR